MDELEYFGDQTYMKMLTRHFIKILQDRMQDFFTGGGDSNKIRHPIAVQVY